MADLFESLDAVEDTGGETALASETPAEEAPALVVEAPAVTPVVTVVEPAEKTVPLTTLIEERRKFQSRIDTLENTARLSPEDSALLKTLREQQQKQPEIEIPDFAKDPQGHLDAKLRLATAGLEKIQKQTESLTVAQAEQVVIQQAAAVEASFQQQTPDYLDALTHVRNVRAQQLQMMAPQATAEQIKEAIRVEEINAVKGIMQRGGNPAEFAYNYAKTLGYAKKETALVAKQATPQLDASSVRTLGSGGDGAAASMDEDEGAGMPEFRQAIKERWRRA